jgi:putative ABC transport system substrate-binding protein
MGRWRDRVLRRAVLAAVVALVVSGCSGAVADQRADDIPTVAILRAVPASGHEAFIEELRAQGWTPGRNVRIVPADPASTVTPEEAAASLRRWSDENLAIVIAYSTPLARVVEERTDVPGIAVVNDPVAVDLLRDPDRPDGQLTAVSFQAPADRTLDLAQLALGGVDRIGYLDADDPATPAHRAGVVAAAEALDIEVIDAPFADVDDLDAAMSSFLDADVDAVYIPNATLIATVLPELEIALEDANLPAIANAPFIDVATVMLAPESAELSRQVARQTVRLLNGTPIDSVPVEAPRRFEVTLDQTRAARLGITIPIEALRQADTVL